MRVNVSFMGVPGAAPRAVEPDGATLSDLLDRVRQEHGDGLPEPSSLLAFVNGQAAGGDWKAVELQDGDDVLFVVPISGG